MGDSNPQSKTPSEELENEYRRGYQDGSRKAPFTPINAEAKAKITKLVNEARIDELEWSLTNDITKWRGAIKDRIKSLRKEQE